MSARLNNIKKNISDAGVQDIIGGYFLGERNATERERKIAEQQITIAKQESYNAGKAQGIIEGRAQEHTQSEILISKARIDGIAEGRLEQQQQDATAKKSKEIEQKKKRLHLIWQIGIGAVILIACYLCEAHSKIQGILSISFIIYLGILCALIYSAFEKMISLALLVPLGLGLLLFVNYKLTWEELKAAANGKYHFMIDSTKTDTPKISPVIKVDSTAH